MSAVERNDGAFHASVSEWLSQPIQPDAFSLHSYDALDPDRDGEPTPLDMSSIEYGADPEVSEIPQLIMSYSQLAEIKIETRVNAVSTQLELDEAMTERVRNEMMRELSIRMDRNQQSMDRLRAALLSHGKPIDDTLRHIIDQARAGNALVPDLLRLIKEYPEMISIEFYKFMKPFDDAMMRHAYRRTEWLMAELAQPGGFEDAEVITYLGEKSRLLSETYDEKNGVYVRKRLIAKINSRDSSTEAIRKETYLIIPATSGREPNEFDWDMKYKRFTNDANVELVIGLEPIGVSAYFRTADYHDRLGYLALEHQALTTYPGVVGVDRFVGDLPILDSEMRELYLKSLAAARRITKNSELAQHCANDAMLHGEELTDFQLDFVD